MQHPTAPDAGVAAIAAYFSVGGAAAAALDTRAPRPAAPADDDGGQGLISFLNAINRNTAALIGAERRKSDLMNAVTHFDAPVIGFAPAAMPYVVPADAYGPKDGWIWAIQRITVAGFGATTDFINVYKGESTADAIAQNALNSFSVPTVGEVATWGPGRTGCLLRGGQRLAFNGTFTGAGCTVTSEVIAFEIEKLPYFCL